MIKRMIIHKDPKILLNLYKALVKPHVEYCVSAWSSYYKKDNELLETVQLRFTKMTKCMQGKSYTKKITEVEIVLIGRKKKQTRFDRSVRSL